MGFKNVLVKIMALIWVALHLQTFRRNKMYRAERILEDLLKFIKSSKAKEIMHRDVFGYLTKNSSVLHP